MIIIGIIKKLSVLSVITLRLMHTKKTHTGAVCTGLPTEVEDRWPAELDGCGCGKMSEYLGFVRLLVFWLL